MNFDPLFIVSCLIALLTAFVVHEYAHGYAAYTLGDPTPKYEGRLTMNPAVHLDPVGSIVLLASLIFFRGGLVMGWAKPVRFDADNLKQPVLDGSIIAFAGPMSNFLVAFAVGILFHLGLPLGTFGVVMCSAHLGFGLFNCIPWPPLDGWKIIQAFLPHSVARSMQRTEQRLGIYSLAVLLLLSFVLVDPILKPIFRTLMELLVGQTFSR